MATIISTKTSGVGGLSVTGDASGILQLASADGTTALTIDGSQNVGIGTSSPTPTNASNISPKLVVTGAGVVHGIQSIRAVNPGSGGAQIIASTTRGTDTNSYTALQLNDGIGTLSFNGADGTRFIPSAMIVAQVDGAVSTDNVLGRLAFCTSAGGANSVLERMRIDSAGNVGIGTSSPAADTAVTIYNGGTALSGTGLLVRSGYPGYSGVVANILSLRDKDNTIDTFNIKTDGSLSLNRFSAAGTYTNSLTVNASGNVGIGTSSPTAKFQVGTYLNAGAAGTALISGANVAALNTAGIFTVAATDSIAADIGGSIGFTANGTIAGYPTGSIAGRRENATASNYASYMQFSTSNSAGSVTERMRIDSSGNLLKGVISAYSTSYGTGEISFATNSAGMVFKCIGASGASVPTVQVFLNGAGTAVGYIAVGASVTNFTNLSDYRLKKDVIPISNALDRLSRIKPVSFIWKESGEIGESFIAHELQEECPIAVVGNKDDVNEDGSIRPQGVDASKLIPVLTAAIQELKIIIDTQNARIEALEAK